MEYNFAETAGIIAGKGKPARCSPNEIIYGDVFSSVYLKTQPLPDTGLMFTWGNLPARCTDMRT
jgi:hypothetical protein